jgi:hypothetical protein
MHLLIEGQSIEHGQRRQHMLLKHQLPMDKGFGLGVQERLTSTVMLI